MAGGCDGGRCLSRWACDWCVGCSVAESAMAENAMLRMPMLTTAALLFLILETRNDYVRFHGKLSLSSPNVYACSDRSAAYQSALLTTPLLVLLLLFNLLIPLPAFLRTFFIVVSVGGILYAAFRAWKDAQEGLERFWLPYIGPVAERWVSEE